jgi:hypothetical protein
MRGHSEHVVEHLAREDLAPPVPGPAALDAYRAAVADLLLDIAGQAGPDDAAKAEAILVARTREPEIGTVLAATPGGAADAISRLLAEVRGFRPGPRSGVADLGGLVRAVLLTQIDVAWWGHLPPYRTDAGLRAAAGLADLERLRRRGGVGFWYPRPARTVATRAVRAAYRWAWPDRAPACPGSPYARARPEVVALLNQVAWQLDRRVDGAVGSLWVTGFARTEPRQRRLGALGYPEFLPSAHCAGYAADVAMAWLRRVEAHGTLAALLLERQRAGDLNVIDEGPTWHVCVSPSAAYDLR